MWLNEQINFSVVFTHILPVDDIKEHKKDSWCSCKPRVIENMIIHNAWDAREFDEQEVAEAMVKYKGRFLMPNGRGDN